MNNAQFISELAKLRPSSTFLSVMGYRNAHDEVSNFSIVFNISYIKTLKRSIEILENTLAAEEIEVRAKRELVKSFNDSLRLAIASPIEAREDGYKHFINPDTNNYIKGIKLHLDTNTLHIYGLVNSKQVITPGSYPKVNRRPLTIAKDRLTRLCPISRFRQFRITRDNVVRISVRNLNLLPPEQR